MCILFKGLFKYSEKDLVWKTLCFSRLAPNLTPRICVWFAWDFRAYSLEPCLLHPNPNCFFMTGVLLKLLKAKAYERFQLLTLPGNSAIFHVTASTTFSHLSFIFLPSNAQCLM